LYEKKKISDKENDSLKSRFKDLYVETLCRARVHVSVIKYL